MANIYEELQEKIRNSFRQMVIDLGYTDTFVIWSYENGTEPQNTYIVLDILEIDQIGHADESTFPTTNPETMDESDQVIFFVTLHELLLQATGVGPKSMEIMANLQIHMRGNRVNFERFISNSLAIADVSSVKKVPQKRDSKWVIESVLDLNLRYSATTQYSVDWARYITINGKAYNVSGEDVIYFTYSDPTDEGTFGDANDSTVGGIYNSL